MSKKLIAVAAAAALALTALVGIAPASATATAVLNATGFVDSTGANDGSTADKAATINVPAQNTLVDTTVKTAGKIDIGATAGDSITVTTTGAVKAIRSITNLDNANVNWNVTTLGKSSHSYTADGSTDDIYVYTTSTTAGSVEVKVTSKTYSLTKTFWVKGKAGLGHAIKVTAPDTVAKLSKGVIVATVTDIFGNAVEDAAASTHAAGKISFTVDRFPQASATVPASLVWNSTAKNYQGEFTSASSSAFTLQVTMLASDGTQFAAVEDIDGIADADDVKILNVNSPATATANATATAQIAALTAQLAESRPKATSVTKKKYNTLARKWNAAFPSQKVALKK